MSIFIIGSNGSGKSTAAQFLAEALGVRYAETGHVVIRELAKLYTVVRDAETEDRWARMIRVCKGDYRPELANLGDLMTRLNPTCLIDACEAPILVSVRRRREVLGYVYGPHRQSWDSVWIRIVGGKGSECDTRFELQHQPCNFEVRNRGNLHALRDTMREIAKLIVMPAA